MKVHVAISLVDYESREIIGVFYSEEEAVEVCKGLAQSWSEECGYTVRHPYPQYFRCAGRNWFIEGWEVK